MVREVTTMARIIEAVYENGVFKPLHPVNLVEGQRVQVMLEAQPSEPLTPQEIQENVRETHRVFGKLSDEDWDDVSQSWKRG
jgi:predicted DNA-binding antitoxin AbrB/MazE fold protein